MSDFISWLPVLALLILLFAAIEWFSDKLMEGVTRKISKYFGHLLTKNVLRSIVAALFLLAALIWWFAGVKTGAFR